MAVRYAARTIGRTIRTTLSMSMSARSVATWIMNPMTYWSFPVKLTSQQVDAVIVGVVAGFLTFATIMGIAVILAALLVVII